MTIKVSIADLYPFETSGITAKIRRQIKKLEENRAKPIKVLIIDGDRLVTNGNNTVYAAKYLGRTEIDAVIESHPNQEMRPYRDALEQAKKKNQKGFENWPLDYSLQDRANRYENL